MAAARSIRGFGKRRMRDVFELGQRFGFDVLPRHFYSSTPDIRELRSSEYWKEPHSMCGVPGADIDDQIRFLQSCCQGISLQPSATEIYEQACTANGAVGYGPIESGFLYRFVCSKRPRRIVQIGAGVSTWVILAAAEATSQDIRITCIDPYPTEFLRRLALDGRISLIEDKAQIVPLVTLLDLGAGDLLFIDSTHTVKPGSEVNRIVLEVLPRLTEGTYVHFHDIYFPFDYSPTILSQDLFFWNETTLLHAFLVGNSAIKLQLSLAHVHSTRPEEIRRHFPDYEPHPAELIRDGRLDPRSTAHFPSSAYLEVFE